MVPTSRVIARGLVLSLGLVLFASAAQADIIYLKDGTILHGRVVQETQTLFDKETGATIPVPKGNGMYAVYDGTRIVAFSRLQLDPNRLPEATDISINLLRLDRKPLSGKPYKNLQGGRIAGLTDFNEAGKRTLFFQAIGKTGPPMKFEQMLTFMNPYQMRVYTLEYTLVQNYLIAELDHNLVKSLAFNFPVLKDEKDPVEKRMRWYRFMVEAKWYDDAAKELDDIEKKLPQAKDRVEKARATLKLLRAETTLTFATRALDAGQLQVTQEFLKLIPKGLDANLNVKVNTLRVKTDGIAKQYEQAMRYLRTLPDGAEGQCAEVLCEAASVLREELQFESLDRLEPFINLAEQAERAKKAGREPTDKPEQLLARAVSGWLLGKESSDARPEFARKLWRARQMATEYIRTPILRDRNAILARYQKSNPVEIDELARIIALLPPPEPAEPLATEDFLKPQDRKTSLPSPNHNQVDYRVLVPPEYKIGRPYPMLVVLHDDREGLKPAIERYAYEAIRNGYILVAAEWGSGFGGAYGYNPEERQRVLDVIRDVRYHYHVDPDRIFLSGYGEGGNAAWDVGLSNPDLFAAVVPISSDPSPTLIRRYWPNARHLPFYLVGGEYTGQYLTHILNTMEDWINSGFPCLNVMYQGRGREWFSAELPLAFEWMNRRKRAHPFPELGRWPPVAEGLGSAMCTMRTTDNHFYWLSTDNIKDGNLQEKKGNKVIPAQMQAIVRPGNEITVLTFGLKQVSVWLAPGMIDFAKPVTIHRKGSINRDDPLRVGKIKPDLSLMMEDFLERGDNTRLFVGKISLVP